MPSTSTTSEQTASVRNLKRVIVALILSNLGLGLFSVYLLRAMDRRYSELLNRSVPALNDLQTLTAQAVAVMRGTGPTLLNGPVNDGQALVQSAQDALKRDRELRNRLLGEEWMASTPDGKEDFQKAGDEFTQTSSEVLKLFSEGKIEQARRTRDGIVRAAFDHYVNATTKVADFLQKESQRTNLDFSAKTNSISTIILSLASWPLLVFGVLLLLVVVLVIAMMVAFRGKDMADAP